MFRILFCTIMLVASINAEPLSCYLCVGSLTSDCFNGDTSSMVIQQCQDFSQSFTFHNSMAKHAIRYLKERNDLIETKCVSYTSAFANNGENFIERGCGYIYVNVDICEYMEAIDPTYPINDCSSCSTSLCNDGVF